MSSPDRRARPASTADRSGAVRRWRCMWPDWVIWRSTKVPAGGTGVNGGPIWCGAALALYVAGLGYLAQHESSRGRAPYWPLALLAVPIVFAMLINSAEFRVPAMWLSLVLALWIALRVRTIFQAAETNVGHIQ